MACRVSADIGGTFTDFVVEKSDHRILIGKVPTTPENPALGVMQGLQDLISETSEIAFFVHGTTVGLNSFLERKGERVLLVMTAGHSDSYAIARGDRLEMYDPHYRKPKRLVPRRDVLEVRERVNRDGVVLTPLQEEDLVPIIEKVKREKINAVAVCFLHAFAFPEHEIKAGKILKAALPDVSISLSHKIAREWREYERSSTSVLNAYVAPVTERYLTRLNRELDNIQVNTALHVMQSNGGVMTVDAAKERPVSTLLSGPVGGTMGGVALSSISGRPNLICVDMGGTSFDLSLIIDGKPEITSETHLEGLPLLMPVVNIHTIGTGGGSLAWLEADAIRVGPKSAGAVPGPVCYGKGGTQPTVTDANLLLKRLGTDSLLDGNMRLEEQGAAKAISKMAQQIGTEDKHLAEGILSISNANMADAIRTITIEQGIDPREFTLVAFGGAGPMQAAFLAQELDIKETIIPRFPGTFSAWGMLQTDLRHDFTRNFYHNAEATNPDEMEHGFRQLEAEGGETLMRENIPEQSMEFERSVSMRYVGQEFALRVTIEAGEKITAIIESFHDLHYKKYGHSTPDAPVEFVSLSVAALGILDKYESRHLGAPAGSDPKTGTRQAIFEGKTYETPVLRREKIPMDAIFQGPLIVEEQSATTIVPPGFQVDMDSIGNIILRLADH